jgi:hypothetical protein
MITDKGKAMEGSRGGLPQRKHRQTEATAARFDETEPAATESTATANSKSTAPA